MEENVRKQLTQADFLPKAPEPEGKRSGLMFAVISAGLLVLSYGLEFSIYLFSLQNGSMNVIFGLASFSLNLLASTVSLIAVILAIVSLRVRGMNKKALVALILGGIVLMAANVGKLVMFFV